jgi:hypothetical protein
MMKIREEAFEKPERWFEPASRFNDRWSISKGTASRWRSKGILPQPLYIGQRAFYEQPATDERLIEIGRNTPPPDAEARLVEPRASYHEGRQSTMIAKKAAGRVRTRHDLSEQEREERKRRLLDAADRRAGL